jgi:hypothetical protein
MERYLAEGAGSGSNPDETRKGWGFDCSAFRH